MNTIASIELSNTTNRTARPLETLILSMRSELRRSAVYVLIGMILIPVIRWSLRDFFPSAEGEPWRVLILCSLPAIVAIAALRWRLRVDSSGIARRRFIGWDLWSWDDFERGKVLDAEGTSTTYVLKEKPLWARKLTLELLEVSDQSRLEAIVEGLRMRPPLELPGEMALRYSFRKDAVLAPGGLLLRDRGEETRYRWQEVQSIRICRLDRRRRDFESLEIVLPDRTVLFSMRLHQGQPIRSWSATGGGKTPTAEVLAAFLGRFVPRDRLQIDSLSEAPLTHELWQARRAVMDKKTNELKILRRILWVASVLLVLVSFLDYRRGLFAVLGMIGLSAIAIGMFVLLARYIEGDHRERLAALDSQMPEQ